MKQLFYLTTIICGLLLAGCATSPEAVKNTETNSANTASTNTAPANTTVANTVANTATNSQPVETEETKKAKTEIVNSTEKLKEVKFWSAITLSDSSPMLNGEMKFVAPDRFYLKQGENEAIVVGKESYVKENGKWVKSKEDLSRLMDLSKGAMSEEVVKKIKNVRVIGKATVNGKETTLYEHKNVENSIESTTKMWIATDSGLLIKSERATIYNGKVQRLSISFNYDQLVSIEAPKIE